MADVNTAAAAAAADEPVASFTLETETLSAVALVGGYVETSREAEARGVLTLGSIDLPADARFDRKMIGDLISSICAKTGISICMSGRVLPDGRYEGTAVTRGAMGAIMRHWRPCITYHWPSKKYGVGVIRKMASGKMLAPTVVLEGMCAPFRQAVEKEKFVINSDAGDARSPALRTIVLALDIYPGLLTTYRILRLLTKSVMAIRVASVGDDVRLSFSSVTNEAGEFRPDVPSVVRETIRSTQARVGDDGAIYFDCDFAGEQAFAGLAWGEADALLAERRRAPEHEFVALIGKKETEVSVVPLAACTFDMLTPAELDLVTRAFTCVSRRE